jgi:hypothetical protein
MLWVRRDIEFEQVSAPSADLTVALLRLPDRLVLIVSVYMEGANDVALSGTMRLLNNTVSTAQCRGSPCLNVVVASDFYRYDQL